MQIHVLKCTMFLALLAEKNHVMAGGNYKKKIMPKMPKMTKFLKKNIELLDFFLFFFFCFFYDAIILI